MQINGTHQVHGTQAPNAPHFNQRPSQASASKAAQPVDQLDISPAAIAASETTGSDGIRSDLVARLKAQIADGTYESPRQARSSRGWPVRRHQLARPIREHDERR